MTNLLLLGPAAGAAVGAYTAQHYFGVKQSPKDTARLLAKYVIIDLASRALFWSISPSINQVLAKRGFGEKAETIAALAVLASCFVFFNGTLALFEWCSGQYLTKNRVATGAAAFLCGNAAGMATLYFVNKK